MLKPPNGRYSWEMETVTALLRIAARIAGASAALVAVPGNDAPVAAWGVDAAAADALLRAVRRAWPSGAWSFRGYPVVLADGSAALCVVADDRPGLLSAIAAALVSHRLDVITALVFSRATSRGDVEAVDFLWVRRADTADTAPIGVDEVESVGEVLSAILAGSVSVAEIALRSASGSPPGDMLVVVGYDPIDESGHAVLLVEAPDRPGMLLTIARELFQQGAQITRSLVRTADGRAYNRFELSEFSGQPLSSDRREQVRAAVVAALAFGDVSPHAV